MPRSRKQGNWIYYIFIFLMIVATSLGLFGFSTLFNVEADEAAKSFYEDFKNDILSVLSIGEENEFAVLVPDSIKDIKVVNNTKIVVSYTAGFLGGGDFQPIDLTGKVSGIEIKGYLGPGEYNVRISIFRNGKLLIDFNKLA